MGGEGVLPAGRPTMDQLSRALDRHLGPLYLSLYGNYLLVGGPPPLIYMIKDVVKPI